MLVLCPQYPTNGKVMRYIHVKSVESLIKVCYDLKAHPHIVELAIEGVYCTDHPKEFLFFLKLCQLGCFRSLRALHLIECDLYMMTMEAIKELGAALLACAQLETLNLSRNSLGVLKPNDFIYLCSYFPQIRRLQNLNFTDNNIPSISAYLFNTLLKRVSECSQLRHFCCETVIFTEEYFDHSPDYTAKDFTFTFVRQLRLKYLELTLLKRLSETFLPPKTEQAEPNSLKFIASKYIGNNTTLSTRQLPTDLKEPIDSYRAFLDTLPEKSQKFIRASKKL